MRSVELKGFLLFAVVCFATFSAMGHGARVVWELQEDSISIAAMFDDGMPMESAQVTVFSGASPSEPYITGMTDENGNFAFLPCKEESHLWDVQVRKAGHGDMIHISLDSSAGTVDTHTGYTVFQIILMSVCVVWGFVGTALFFASKKKDQNAHS